MSIVHPELPGARVADLFAGSGALGLEALSRGASFCDFVEVAPASLRAIHDNAAALAADPASFAVHRGDALRFVQRLARGHYDIAFADPPYNLGLAPRIASLWLATPFSRVLGVEHDVHESLPPGGVTRTYGGTAVTLYRSDATPEAGPAGRDAAPDAAPVDGPSDAPSDALPDGGAAGAR